MPAANEIHQERRLMIPTPASRLASEPLGSIRRPNAIPLDLERLYHTKPITSIQWRPPG